MTLKTTRWKPDTCGCVIEYEWDSESPESVRVHSVSSVKNKCKWHLNDTNDIACYEKVLNENKTKNELLMIILDKFPGIVDETIDSDTGELKKVLKSGLEYYWNFDEQRKLHVEIKPKHTEAGKLLKNYSKTALKSAIDLKYPDKDIVVD